ncbi:MAG: hydroxyethylthiazole kinase [Armatimonadetes bacterium]|nr:hydroxyethylthiazole kinase [Armatimonadota bacterium]
MSYSEIVQRAAQALTKIRETKPLIHHITNFVVMNDTANVTLHVGALPVMAHAKEEVCEMVRLAGALVLNPGTLNPDWVEAMVLAGKEAQALGIPVVLDPVGAGATSLRTQANLHLLKEVRPTVVRGNAGEIAALRGAGGVVKGVESIGGPADVAALARDAAQAWGCTVAVTGAIDHISDGTRLATVENGSPWLTTLTGTGCTATTVVAAFAAVEEDPLVAAAGGLACLGYAAELAAAEARGPASFKVALYDTLYNLTPDGLQAGARITIYE